MDEGVVPHPSDGKVARALPRAGSSPSPTPLHTGGGKALAGVPEDKIKQMLERMRENYFDEEGRLLPFTTRDLQNALDGMVQYTIVYTALFLPMAHPEEEPWSVVPKGRNLEGSFCYPSVCNLFF